MASSIVCSSNDEDELDGLEGEDEDNYGLSQVCDLFGGTCENWSSRKSTPNYRFSEPCKDLGLSRSQDASAVGSPKPRTKRKPDRVPKSDKSESSKPSVIESSASDSSSVGGCEAAGCSANGFVPGCMNGRSAEAKRFQEEQQRKQKIRELSQTNKALLERMQQLEDEASRQRIAESARGDGKILPDIDDGARIKEQLSAGSSQSNKTCRSLLDNDEAILERDGAETLPSQLQAIETLNQDLQDELFALKKVVEGQRKVKQDFNDVRERYKSIKARNKDVEAELVELKDAISTCTEENEYLSKKLSYLEKRKAEEVKLADLINRDTATRAIILELKHEVHNLKCEVAVERILKQRFKGELQRLSGDEADQSVLRNLFQSEDDIREEILGAEQKLRQEHSFITNKFQKNLETIAEHYWKEEGLLRYEIDSLHTYMHENGMESFAVTESLFDEAQFQASLEKSQAKKLSFCSGLEVDGLRTDEGSGDILAGCVSQIAGRSDSRGLFPDDESDEEDFGPIAPESGKANIDGSELISGRVDQARCGLGTRESNRTYTSQAKNAQFQGNDLKLGSFSAALAGIAVVGAALSARQVDQDGHIEGADALNLASLDRCVGDPINGKDIDGRTTKQLSLCTPSTPCATSNESTTKPASPIVVNLTSGKPEFTEELRRQDTMGDSRAVPSESTTDVRNGPTGAVELQHVKSPDGPKQSLLFLDRQQRVEPCKEECLSVEGTANPHGMASPSSAAVLSDLLQAEAEQALRDGQESQSIKCEAEVTDGVRAVELSHTDEKSIQCVVGIPIVVADEMQEGEMDTVHHSKPESTSLPRVEEPVSNTPRKCFGVVDIDANDDARERSSVTLDGTSSACDETLSEASDEETTGPLSKTFNLFTEPQKWGNSVDDSPVLLALENYVCSGIDTADSQILSQSGIFSETQGSVTSGSILSDGQPLNPAPSSYKELLLGNNDCPAGPLAPLPDSDQVLISDTRLRDKDEHDRCVPREEAYVARLRKSEPVAESNGTNNVNIPEFDPKERPIKTASVAESVSIRGMVAEANSDQDIDIGLGSAKGLNKSEHSAATDGMSNLNQECELKEQTIAVIASIKGVLDVNAEHGDDEGLDGAKSLDNKPEWFAATDGTSDSNPECEPKKQPIKATAAESSGTVDNMQSEAGVDTEPSQEKELSFSERIAMFEKSISAKKPAKDSKHPWQKPSSGLSSGIQQTIDTKKSLPQADSSSLELIDEEPIQGKGVEAETELDTSFGQTLLPPESEEGQCTANIELVSVSGPKPSTFESEIRAMAEDFFVLKGDASSDQGSHLSMLPRREICVDGATDHAAVELLRSNEEALEADSPKILPVDIISEDSGIVVCSSSEATSAAPYCGEVADELLSASHTKLSDEVDPIESGELLNRDVAPTEIVPMQTTSKEPNHPSSAPSVSGQTDEFAATTPPLSPTSAFLAYKRRNEQPNTDTKEAVVDLIRITNGDGVPLLVPALTPSFDSSNRTKSLGAETEQAKDRHLVLPTVEDSDTEDSDASSWSTISVSRSHHGATLEDSMATMLNGKRSGRKKNHSKEDLMALHQWGMIPGSGRNSPQNDNDAGAGKVAATSDDGPEGEALYEHEDYNEAMIIRAMPSSENVSYSMKAEKPTHYNNMTAVGSKEAPQMQDDVSELSQSMDGRTPYLRRRTTSPGTSLESLPRFDDRRYDRNADEGDWVDTMVRGFSSLWS